MIKNNYLFRLCLLIFVTACATTRQHAIEGEFKHSAKTSFGSITFREHRFSYQYGAGNLYQVKSEGTYIQKGNKLILMSDLSFKTGHYISEVRKENSPGSLKIIDSDGKPLEGIPVLINNHIEFISNEYGTVPIGDLKKEVMTIRLNSILLSEDQKQFTNKSGANKFVFKIVEKDEGKLFFNNKRAKLHKDLLTIGKINFVKQH